MDRSVLTGRDTASCGQPGLLPHGRKEKELHLVAAVTSPRFVWLTRSNSCPEGTVFGLDAKRSVLQVTGYI